ncbi:2TM domain-containing protein [Algibacter mikhailovii]|uniref:2TM domain-containing protein n=1 Tax=Algibacter mikhailovii TaxID=425498 RepID=UPI002494F5AE|nr:2TM domain-containing protein [Algibacter mikhailovii]
MEENKKKEQSYIQAKNKVKKLKMFYFHLIGYVIMVVLLCYNLVIVEDEYRDFFTWFNITIMIAWGGFIILHALSVFKNKTFFSKKWENKKVQDFINKETKSTKWE